MGIQFNKNIRSSARLLLCQQPKRLSMTSLMLNMPQWARLLLTKVAVWGHRKEMRFMQSKVNSAEENPRNGAPVPKFLFRSNSPIVPTLCWKTSIQRIRSTWNALCIPNQVPYKIYHQTAIIWYIFKELIQSNVIRKGNRSGKRIESKEINRKLCNNQCLNINLIIDTIAVRIISIGMKRESDWPIICYENVWSSY